ncbi:DUF2690 domain-containing protein [Streptomyces sp. NPDC000151]|uniref:DUF2690 domain-containing protein n=1 Tax=Streptomyces sp. NPDC000151 TaxID=3154244 RepID=UPI003326AD14
MAQEDSWLRRHGPETLGGALILAVVTTVLTVGIPLLAGDDEKQAQGSGNGPPAPTAAVRTEPPSCTMNDCAGLEPDDTRCDAGAVTLADDWSGPLHVSVRYSPACKAVWGKLTGAEVGDTIEIAVSPTKKERRAVRTGHTQFTPMLPAGRTFSAEAAGTSVKGDPDHDIPAGHRLPVGADQNDVPPA